VEVQNHPLYDNTFEKRMPWRAESRARRIPSSLVKRITPVLWRSWPNAWKRLWCAS